jgi:hypothetical protein
MVATHRWARSLLWLVLLTVAWIPKQSAGQPAAAQTASRWNLLAEGGKGEMHGAPKCHPLTYFTRSPKKLDIDSDLYGATPAKLTDKVTVTRLGSIDGHEAYEVLHMVHSPDVFVKGLKVQDTELQLRMKLLLVERGHAEFCDIYQLQQTDSASTPRGGLHEAGVLTIDGHGVLKTIDQDEHTWSIGYWTMDGEGPLRLSTDEVALGVSDVAPKGSEVNEFTLDELNLQSDVLEVPVTKPDDTTPIGAVELIFTIRGDKLVARSKRWLPASEVE